jgi:predicted aldo/keto reductase-like oxidoreductase
MQRRSFFGAVFAGLASAKPPKAKSGGIPTRPLGKTGEKLTIIGEGGARFQLVPFEEGKAVVRRAYDLGINYFDMARSYADGHAEEVYGAVVPEFRKDIFLTTKSLKRTRQGAEEELNTSLKTLRTDHVDLWQMHLVRNIKEVEQIFAPGGAVEAFEAAKKAGKCRFIGFTSCKDPQMHVEMLRRSDRFDTALMPLHIADPVFSDDPKTSFEKTALPAACEHGVGALAIKTFANAFLLRTFCVSDCLRYTLSLPITATPLGFCTIGQLEDDVRVAQNFKPFTQEEMAALRARAATGKVDATRGPALEYWKTR